MWVSCIRLIFINFVLFHSPIKEKASSDPKNKKAAAAGKQGGAAEKKADAKPAANRKPTQKKKSQLDDKQEYAALRDAIDGEYCHGSATGQEMFRKKNDPSRSGESQGILF